MQKIHTGVIIFFLWALCVWHVIINVTIHTGPMSKYRCTRQCTPHRSLLPRLDDSLSTWQPANKASVSLLAEACFCETSIKGNTFKFLFLLQNIFMLHSLLTSGAIMGDHRHTVILKEFSSLSHLPISSHCIDRQLDDSNWDEKQSHCKVLTSLRKRNYCHYGKNTRGQHTSPGRVNLGTF